MMKKQDYREPNVRMTEIVPLEGLICASIKFNLHVNELENVNVYEDDIDEDFFIKS